MKKYFGLANMVVIVLTIIFFGIALFTTGLTHDILLEAGVLLVSVKLIMMSYKTSLSNRELIEKINEISEKLDQIKKN